MIRRSIIIFILVLAGSVLRAQYYDTGQEPASFSWEKLESHHFTFIYPETYSDRIDRVVYSFERAYDLLKGSYKEPLLDNIPVIIHNHTVQSNGYVVWAPKRIELYPLPGQDNIPMDHIEQLALHELMHVLQMHSFKRGISKSLSWLFGEQYTGALGIYTPYWFLEGEAVIAESAWSYSGRGRYPFFEKRLKAVLLDKDDIYSYDKLLFGSYRDYTPDHYQFGYQMSAWARINLEENIWQRAMDYIALKPYTLNPFNVALKKYSDHSKEDIYYETMVSLRNRWQDEEEKYMRLEYPALNPSKGNDYINYYSPVAAGKDSIIAVKTSLYDVPRFVLVNPSVGEEKRLHTPGYIWPYRINYAKGIIVWAEKFNDPRWANREYSVIKKLDIRSGESHTLTVRSRLFGPDISPDGKYIVAAESTVDHKNSIVILDASSGAVVSRHESPGNSFISYPSWSDDMKEIVFISSTEKGEGIRALDTQTGAWLTYLEEGRDDLQSVRKKASALYFSSSASGIDNAYMMEEGGDTRRITSSRFGISDLSLARDGIIFSDYTAGGNNIALAGSDKSYGNLPVESTISDRAVNKLDSEEKLAWDEQYTLPSHYKKENYSKAGNLFRFHSWMPFYTDINNISYSELPLRPGAMVMTQNNLSTLISTIGYEYRNSEHLFHTGISWKGWYPAIDFRMTYGGSPVIYNGGDTSVYPSKIYNRFSSNTSIYVPLHFNRGRFRQTLWPSVNISYHNNYIVDEDKDMFDYGQTLISSRLYLSNLHRMAYRDIWPRLGQVIDLNYSRSLSDSDLYGPVYTLRTAFYFPGLLRNHGLKLAYQAEMKEFRRLILQNRISLPRGYQHVIAEKVNSFSMDYAFPLFYPDFHLGSLMYVNRIRNTVFADYAISNDIYDSDQGGIIEGRDYLSSLGMELLADFYLLRIPVRLSGGVQAAYLPYEKSFHFGLLLNMDVFGFVLSDRRSY